MTKPVSLGSCSRLVVVLVALTLVGWRGGSGPSPRALFTTDPTGRTTNQNLYASRLDVYISGGPHRKGNENGPRGGGRGGRHGGHGGHGDGKGGGDKGGKGGGLRGGDWVFQVTDPSGHVLLSLDPAACRIVRVKGGAIVSLRDLGSGGLVDHSTDDSCHVGDSPDGEAGASAAHDTNRAGRGGGIVVQLMPFAETPNQGGVYKAWILPLAVYLQAGGDLDRYPDGSPDPGFSNPHSARTDNFKIKRGSNQAPIADAGDDQTAPVGALVTLDGSASFDPDGDALTFAWQLIGAPAGSSAALSNPAAVRPKLQIDVEGTYLVELVVDDGHVASAPDQMMIDTVNSAPIAAAGADQTVPLGAIVTLDGGGSSDADGDLLSFSWTLVERPVGSIAALDDPTSVRPTFVADVHGDYRVELVVDDGSAASPPDEVVITTENSVPVASAGADQTVPLGVIVTLDGGGSSDVDADPLTFLWSLVSVPAGSTATLSDQGAVSPTFVADLPGDYVVQLVVNDGIADSEPDRVVVSTENSSPVSSAGPDQTVAVGETVTLDGTGSHDADGDPLTFSWSLLSAPAGSLAMLDDPSAPRPTFVADLAGDYVAQLITSDGEAGSAPDTVTVTAGNSRPVADAGPDQMFLVEDEERVPVQLDGSGSFDVDGDELKFFWSIVSAPPFSFPSFDDPTLVMPTLFLSDVIGDYVVQLIVSDGRLESEPDTVTIEHENIAPFAHAGPDQTAFVGDTVQLDGSQSFDLNGDPLTFVWSFVSLPEASQAVLDDPTSVMPTFVMDTEGTYIVHLVVDDGELDSEVPGREFFSNVTITTANAPPEADAGPDQSVLVGDFVFLDGTGSTDPEADPLTFFWALLSRPAASAAQLDDPTLESPSFEVDQPGTYLAQLIVNDGEADSAPDSVLVSTVGSRPVAAAGDDQTVFVQRIVQLDGTSSSDADGDPLTFFWAITSQPAGSTATLDDPTAEQPTFFADLPGIYLVQLIVNDGGADSVPDSVVIEALPTKTLRLFLDSPVVGIDRSIGGTLILGEPAPTGGLPVTLTSDDPTVAAIAPAQLTVPEGGSSVRITVDGFVVGATVLRATAPDYSPGAAAIEVTDFLISIDELVEVAPGESVSLPVSLSQPAPPGGLTLFFEVDDPGIATVTPSVFVPGGQQLPGANPQITGGTIGETIVRASAERFAPDQATLRVTLQLRFPREFYNVAADTRDIELLLSAPAPPGGLVLDLATDDPAIATVPPTITAPAGVTSVGIPVTGVSDGDATLRASAPGVDEAMTTIAVGSEIFINPVTVGKDLQRTLSASLEVEAPEEGKTVTITSADPSRLLLSTSESEVGTAQVTVELAGGERHATVWAQALAAGGSVAVTATAEGHQDGSGSVDLVASGFAWTTGAAIDASTFDANLPLDLAAYPLRTDTLGFFVGPPQALRPGIVATVDVTSSDPAVAALLGSPVTFGPGESQHQVQLDLLAAGGTTLSIATPAPFSTPSSRTDRLVTVTAPAIFFGDSEVGAQLQIQHLLSLEAPPPAPVDVTLTVADPSVAIVSAQRDQIGSGVLVLPELATDFFGPVYVQGLAVGTTTITLEAPGYATRLRNVEVFPSGVRFTSALGLNTTTLSSPVFVDLVPIALIRFNERQQDVRGGFSVEVEVTSSDPSVAAVLGPALLRLVPPGRIGVEVDGLAAGTSQLTVVQPPGFVAPGSRTQRTITVEQPRILVSSAAGGIDDFRVGRDLQGLLGFRLSSAPPAPTDVVVSVDSPIATLSTDSTVAGSSSVTFAQTSGTFAGELWVQGLSLGTTTITTTAAGYATHVLALEISPSGFEITVPSGSEIGLTTLQPNQGLTIAPTPLDPTTLELYRGAGIQPLRPGLSIAVPVVSSSPGVAAITDSPVTVVSATQNGGSTRGFTEIDPLTAGATVVEAQAPAGFTAPASGHQKLVMVDAPNLRFQFSSLTVGRDLQASGVLILETAPPETVELTITSSSAAVATVAGSQSEPGAQSVTFQIPQGGTSVRFWVEGRAVGTTQFTAQAAGYDDGVLSVRVLPSGFVHAGQGDLRLSASAPPFDRQVIPALLAQTTLDFVESQPVRPGLTVQVTVTSSDPTVAGVLGVPISVSHLSSGTYQVEPLAVGTAVLTIATPAGFDTPSERTEMTVIVDP